MTDADDRQALDAVLSDADTAPPLVNGELTFEAPWQGRVFGMARVLAEAGYYDWDEFRVRLIAEISDWEATASAAELQDYQYYDRFLTALTELLARKNLIEPQELDARATELAARPHGHDH